MTKQQMIDAIEPIPEGMDRLPGSIQAHIRGRRADLANRSKSVIQRHYESIMAERERTAAFIAANPIKATH